MLNDKGRSLGGVNGSDISGTVFGGALGEAGDVDALGHTAT